MSDALSRQVGGSHYKNLGMQPAEFCMRNHWDFSLSSTLKYLTRFPQKGGLEDVGKGKHFLEIRADLCMNSVDLYARLRSVSTISAEILELMTGRRVAVPAADYCALNGIHPSSCCHAAILALEDIHAGRANEAMAIRWIDLILSGREKMTDGH